jgi:hypothetical protein
MNQSKTNTDYLPDLDGQKIWQVKKCSEVAAAILPSAGKYCKVFKNFLRKSAQRKMCSFHSKAVIDWKNKIWLRFFRAQVKLIFR